MKFSKASVSLVAVSVFLSIGVCVSEASGIHLSSASPTSSVNSPIGNGYGFCLGVSRTTAVVNVQCSTNVNGTSTVSWTSSKSSRTSGYNIQVSGGCLTAPALKDGQDLFLSACGAVPAAQQDWIGFASDGIKLIESNFCLDVEVGVPQVGSPIQIYTCQGLTAGVTRIPAQRWTFNQALFNQSQANAPATTTIAYQPPGRALPPTQQVTTTIYVGPPARGTTTTVPAVTKTTVPKRTVVATPTTVAAYSKCKGLDVYTCIDRLSAGELLTAMSDVFRKYLNKTTNCSTYFCYANWEKILRNLASSVRSNSISECSSEARKTLKTWFRPDTIKMSLDALNLYLTAVVAIAELYDVGNNLVEFNKLIRETGKTTVIEQMSKLAKKLPQVPNAVQFTKDLIKNTKDFAENVRKRMGAEIQLTVLSTHC